MMGYDERDCIEPDAIPPLDPGTSLLVAGPPMVGKREFALDLMTAGYEDGDGLLVIMTSESAAVVLEDLSDQLEQLDPQRIGVIDCLDNNDRQSFEGIQAYSLSSPDDLTGISTTSAMHLRSFADNGIKTVRHGLICVTTLLQYLERDTVFKFLYIYKKRIADTRGLGVFTIDRTRHEERTLTMFESLFDGMLDLRVGDNGEPDLHTQGI